MRAHGILPHEFRNPVKIVPHNRLTFGADEADAAACVVRSGYWSSGSVVAELEKELANKTRRAACAVVGSGLGAIRLALIALGVKRDDSVIIPAYSCVALANAVLACGAQPILADVRADEWNLDPAAVNSVRRRDTKAIIAVNTFGLPADISGLRATGLPVIEDFAHGMRIGDEAQLSEVAITSFHATKLIGAGEGGAVLTDAVDIDAVVRRYRDYGDQHASGLRLNDKMTDICAVIARTQLRRLDDFIVRRESIARRYLELLRPLEQRNAIILPAVTRGRIWYRFAIEVIAIDVDQLIARLREQGVICDKPVYDWRNEFTRDVQRSDRAYRNIVSLPLYPTLEQGEQDIVVDVLNKTVSELRNDR